jgi:hypothetical protein
MGRLGALGSLAFLGLASAFGCAAAGRAPGCVRRRAHGGRAGGRRAAHGRAGAARARRGACRAGRAGRGRGRTIVARSAAGRARARPWRGRRCGGGWARACAGVLGREPGSEPRPWTRGGKRRRGRCSFEAAPRRRTIAVEGATRLVNPHFGADHRNLREAASSRRCGALTLAVWDVNLYVRGQGSWNLREELEFEGGGILRGYAAGRPVTRRPPMKVCAALATWLWLSCGSRRSRRSRRPARTCACRRRARRSARRTRGCARSGWAPPRRRRR